MKTMSNNLITLRLGVHACGLAVLLAISAAFYFFVFQAFESQVAEDQFRARQLSALLHKSEAAYRQYETTNEQLTTLNTLVHQIHQRIPSQSDLGVMLTAIDKAAATEGLKVGDFHRGESVEAGSFSQLDVRLICTGRYSSVCRFLHSLHNLPWECQISQLTLRTGADMQTIPVEIQIRVLYHAGASTPAAPSHI